MGTHRGEGRLANIFEAAAEVFVQAGFHGATFAALASAANVAHSTFFRLVKNKLSLYKSAFDFAWSEINARIADELFLSEVDTLEGDASREEVVLADLRAIAKSFGDTRMRVLITFALDALGRGPEGFSPGESVHFGRFRLRMVTHARRYLTLRSSPIGGGVLADALIGRFRGSWMARYHAPSDLENEPLTLDDYGSYLSALISSGVLVESELDAPIPPTAMHTADTYRPDRKTFLRTGTDDAPISDIVLRLFRTTAFLWSGIVKSPIAVDLPGTLYRTVVRRDGLRYDAQIYRGLGHIGGHFWEQDLSVLLRVATLGHPALQQVTAGGYDEDADSAYVVTSSTPYTLHDQASALSALRASPPRALEHFALLADGLAILHGQGLLHRNIWPGTVRFTEGVEEVRLSRFEMGALVDNILRGAGDELISEQQRMFLEQPSSALLHAAPERIEEVLGPTGTGFLETGAADIFSLAVLVTSWFVADLDLDVLNDIDRTDTEALSTAIQDFHRSARDRVGDIRRGDAVPEALSRLLLEMLSRDPRARPTAHQVVGHLMRYRDEILATWERPTGLSHLVLFMPRPSRATLYHWGFLANDPGDAHGQGPIELRELIEQDLRGAMVAHSERGAKGYVSDHSGDAEALKRCKIVLIGAKFAWFCQEYRQPDPATGKLGAPWDQALVIMFVTEHSRVQAVRELPYQRSLPRVDVLRTDLHPADLIDARRGRPTWTPLLESTRSQTAAPQWQQDWLDGFDWLLELRRSEILVGTYPYKLDGLPHGRRVEAAEDRARRHEQLSNSSVASELASAMHNPGLGDYLEGAEDGADTTDSGTPDRGDTRPVGVRVVYWPGSRRRPGSGARGKGTAWRIGSDRVALERDGGSPTVPEIGMICPAETDGSALSLRRQETAVAQLASFPGLLGQFKEPTTIRGLRHPWVDAGKALSGGADQVVVRMLTSQPFFAVQGPPGTGKTTVVAHALAAYFARDHAARVLVSAQSNAALDNVANRVMEQILEHRVACLPLRVATRGVELTDAMSRLGIKETTRRVMDQLAERANPPAAPSTAALRYVLSDWRAYIPHAGAELTMRIRKGANLIFATCEGSDEATLGHRSPLPPFDWVIVEEAAKAWPTELAIPLVRGTRWTLIGDHKQLPAHRLEEVEALFDRCAHSDRPDLKELRGRLTQVKTAFHLFEGLFKDDRPARDVPAEVLTRQFRMREAIASVVNHAFYDGKLQTADEAEARRHGLTQPPFVRDRSLIWLDTTGWIDEDKQFWMNEREAEVTAALVRALTGGLDAARAWSHTPLAILTPYQAQRRAIASLGVGPVHTVHSFQGNEAEIVVASLVRTTDRGGPRRSLGHLSKPEVANVLLSRARRLLILIGKLGHFEDSGVPHWRSICETVRREGHVVPWHASGLVDP